MVATIVLFAGNSRFYWMDSGGERRKGWFTHICRSGDAISDGGPRGSTPSQAKRTSGRSWEDKAVELLAGTLRVYREHIFAENALQGSGGKTPEIAMGAPRCTLTSI